MDIWLVIAGISVGLLVGLTGVGGGSVMTPLLIGAFGVPSHIAVGTDLAAAAITKSVGTAVHGWAGRVNWPLVKAFTIGSVPGAIIALLVLRHFGVTDPLITKIIRYTVAVCVMATAAALFLKPFLTKRAVLKAQRLGIEPHKLSKPLSVPLAIIAGFVIGVLVAVSSIGAGAIGAIVMLWLQPQLSSGELAGSDIAHAVPLTTVAAIGHGFLGTINLSLLGALLIGTIPGILLGSLIVKRIPERWLRAILASTLTLAAAKLVS